MQKRIDVTKALFPHPVNGEPMMSSTEIALWAKKECKKHKTDKLSKKDYPHLTGSILKIKGADSKIHFVMLATNPRNVRTHNENNNTDIPYMPEMHSGKENHAYKLGEGIDASAKLALILDSGEFVAVRIQTIKQGPKYDVQTREVNKAATVSKKYGTLIGTLKRKSQDQELKKKYIIQTLGGSTLEHWIRSNPNASTTVKLTLLRTIIIELVHLNKVGYSHEDIHSRNILVDMHGGHFRVLLIDFTRAERRFLMTGDCSLRDYVGIRGFVDDLLLHQCKELRELPIGHTTTCLTRMLKACNKALERLSEKPKNKLR